MTAAMLGKALVTHQARAESLREEIVRLEEREQEAVRGELKKAPSKNPFSLVSSPAMAARRALERARKELATLEASVLPQLQEEATRAAREEAEKAFERFARDVSGYQRDIDAEWELLRGDFAIFQAAHAERAGALQQRRRELFEAARESLGGHSALLEKADSVLEAAGSLPDLPSALERLRGELGIAAQTVPVLYRRGRPIESAFSFAGLVIR